VVKLLIEKIRYDKNMSLKQLSRKSGISKSHIWGVELGHRNPTITTLCQIARGLKVPCYELLECNCVRQGETERKCKYNG
jgi:transcriptional regulator with XRE-family HTH domain